MPTPPADWTDPCERAEYLRLLYFERVASGGVRQVTINTPGGGGRSVAYEAADLETLRDEIRRADDQCAIITGVQRIPSKPRQIRTWSTKGL